MWAYVKSIGVELWSEFDDVDDDDNVEDDCDDAVDDDDVSDDDDNRVGAVSDSDEDINVADGSGDEEDKCLKEVEDGSWLDCA